MRSFFIFSAYRVNVGIRRAELFVTDEDGRRDYRGILAFPGEKAPEKNTKAKGRMIVNDDVRGKMAGIFDDIKNKYLSLQHICPDYDAIRTYPLSRMIMIFASFEIGLPQSHWL